MSNQVIKGFEDYLITEDGKIYSIRRKLYLKPQNTAYGYLHNTLTKNCIKTTKVIHRLVAEAFIPNPKGLPQINHIDGNKKNNNVSNLEWCTAKHNIIHAYRTGLSKAICGEEHYSAKLNWLKVNKIRLLYKTKKLKQTELAKKFQVDQGLISKIIHNKYWKICVA